MKPSLENLESRLVPAKITMINSTTMMVDARQDAVPLKVTGENNEIIVNGQKVNTSNIKELNIQGSNFNDMIDLEPVNKFRLVSNTHNGDDYVKGTRLDDVIAAGNGWDRLFGNSGNDKLYGENGNDFISGEYGNDFISGGDGNDSLRGDEGNDQIYGNKGRDTLVGGEGFDHLCGDDFNEIDEVDDIWTGGYYKGESKSTSAFEYSRYPIPKMNTIANKWFFDYVNGWRDNGGSSSR